MQSPCAYGFDQGVGFDFQQGGDFARALAGVQLALRLRHDGFGEDGRTPVDALGEEARRAAGAVEFDGAFEVYLGDAEGSGQLSLLGPASDVKDGADQSK